MFVAEFGGYRKDKYKDQLRDLEEACNWLGIERGRAQAYGRLLREFHEEDKRTQEHILGYHESCEITDIYSVWNSRVDEFPGLKAKISRVLSSGPTLREGEKSQTSNNRPRNDAFVYYLAGKLMSADLRLISVDGALARGVTGIEDADITLLWDSDKIDVQCKRPQTLKAFYERVNEARKQIERKNRCGVIAIDCSAWVRPSGGLLRCKSRTAAHGFIADKLQPAGQRALEKHAEKFILGLLLFARVPVNRTIGESPVLDHQGKPSSYYFLRESISSFVIFNNYGSRYPDLLRSTSRNLKRLMPAS